MRVREYRSGWLQGCKRWLRWLSQQYWMPLLCGVVTTGFILCVWHQLMVQERLHVQELVQQEAKAVMSELNRELSAQVLTLERIAHRWQISGGTPRKLWEAEVAKYSEHSFDYQAIQWVDPSFRVQWLVPLEGNEAARNLDLSQEPRRRLTLQIARDLQQTILSRPISLVQGGKGFLACVPLFVPEQTSQTPTERFDGFIVGVFQFQNFFDRVLKVSPRYQVQISDRSGLLYSQGIPSASLPPQTAKVQIYSTNWDIEVFPTPVLLAEGRTLLPAVVLWGGLVGAWGLALLIFLGQRAEQQTRRTQRINQQLHAEIAQRQQSEKQYRQLIYHLNAGFVVHAPDTQILQCNPAACELLGLSMEQMLGQAAMDPSWHFVREDGTPMPTAESPVNRVLSTQTAFRDYVLGISSAAQVRAWVLVNAFPEFDADHQLTQVVVTFINISRRKQVEELLAKELLRSRTLFDTSMDGIVVMSQDGAVVQASPSFAKMLGYTLEETLSLTVFDWAVQSSREELQKALAMEEVMPLFETRHRRKDGSIYDVEVSWSRVELDNELINFCICRDISDRKRVEEERKAALIALSASQQRYQNLVENSPDIIERFDLELRHLYVSPALTQITGIAAETFLGKTCRDLGMDEDMIDTWETAAATLLRTGQKQVIEFSVPALNGIRYFEMAIMPEVSEQQTIESILCISRDITERQQSEAALRQSEATKQAIIQAIPDLLIRMYPDGSFAEFISDSYFNLVTPDQECHPGHINDFLPPDLAQLRLYYAQAALESNITQIYEQKIDVFGKQCYEEVRIVPLQQEGGVEDGAKEVLVMVRDITDHKQAEIALQLSEERLQLALEASGDGLWDWNITTGDIYLDSSYQEMLGYAYGELVIDLGAWEQMIHPDDRCWVIERLKAHLNNDAVDYIFDYRVRCKTGEWKWIADYGKVVSRDSEGNPLRMIGTHKDISDRKHQELKLRQAMEAAEAANQAKSIFLANMSHELRTPLNVILGFAQVMMHDPSLTPNQKEDLETIQRSGDHLLCLINEVLDLSKIDAGHCTLAENGFDLIALLHTLRTMMTERAFAKHLHLHFDIAPEVPQFVSADEQKLRQVLLNLLSNAIKFTEQGQVKLSVSVIQQSKPTGNRLTQKTQGREQLTLQFEVADTGVGIAASEQEIIFDAFVQAGAGKRSMSGTGLGLTISRKLLELMQGEISVSSVPNVGSTFVFRIPVCPTSSVQIRPEQQNRLIIGLAPAQSGRRILVVDDQPENRQLLLRLLAQLELEVREATNGQEAIQIWQEWQPDLTWMDIRMPGMDGYEAIRQIRAMEHDKTSVIIALTAQASQSDRTLALAAGCDDYISKPFREETLFLKLQEYLGLQYRYAEASLPSDSQSDPFSLYNPTTPVLDATLLTNLSAEWLHHLEDAAICGNDRAILTLVAQLPPQLACWRTQLIELAETYQFEQILQLISFLPFPADLENQEEKIT